MKTTVESTKEIGKNPPTSLEKARAKKNVIIEKERDKGWKKLQSHQNTSTPKLQPEL